MQTVTRSLKDKKAKVNKLVLGFVGIAATTVIGTAGVAAAQQTNSPNALNPPSKAACAHYAQYGFKNHGQCVAWWEHHNNPAHGYGGGGNNNSVGTSVNVNVNGNNNVINVVIKYIFG
ncbi:MAG TPA: hypothetical protein VLG92_03560 [Candidatus Saccharimonadia bacterium]|nr:hypothetical protein [Candidatus Saccharimonadia bacterium]